MRGNFSIRRFVDYFLLPLLAVLAFGAEAKPFNSGDRVVFFGDSITHVGHWTRDVMLYYVTRFPNRDIVFMNGGQCGDNAYNARVARVQTDVFGRKATDVAVMFGMNDVGRFDYETNATPEQIAVQRKHIDDYGKNIRDLFAALKAGLPSARFLCLTPTPCDDTASTAPNAGSLAGSNGGITAEAQHVVDAAEAMGWQVVDENAAVNAYIRRRRLAEPEVTFCTDRVHVNEAVHFLMAETFLRAQAVPCVVSDVRLMEGRVLGVRNAEVSDLVWSANRIAFTLCEGALPWPTVAGEEKGAVSIDDDFNQQILALHALGAGDWSLGIDGETVCTADARTWALGVNLGGIRTTPQYRQALKVREELVKDYEVMIRRQAAGFSIRRAVEFQMRRMRLDSNSEADRAAWYAERRKSLKGRELDDYDDVMANYGRLDAWAAECDGFFTALRALAKPVSHRYELSRVGKQEL